MIMARIAALAAVFLMSAPALADTTVFVVRHAEKVTTKGVDDPALTARGTQRAAKLARMLDAAPIAAVYTTKYQRNRATAAPTAQAHGRTVIVYDAKDTPKLVKTVRQHDGQHLLVVGHSNTVPEILAAFGVKQKVTIGHDDYDDLFIVHLNAGGATLSHLKFTP